MTDTVIDVIANEVAIVLTQCYTEMGNEQLLSVTAPHGNVHIHNCNLEQATNGVSMSCQPESIHLQSRQLPAALQNAVSHAVGGGVHADTVAAKVSESVTSEAVAGCAVMAMNRVRLDLYTEDGNVDINGCDFRQQTATTIKQCVHNVEMSDGSGPLGLYLTRELNSGKFSAVRGIGGEVVPLSEACAVNQSIGAASLALLVLGVMILFS